MAFTREELFELIWSRPVRAVAKDIGVSDVAIGKACRRARIPMPGRGHWLSSTRQSAKRPPLPAPHHGFLQRIEFTIQPRVALPVPECHAANVAPLPIPQRLTNPHPLVKATLSALRDSVYVRNGGQFIPYDRFLRVRVTKGLIHRAGIVLHMVITALEKNGCAVRIDSKRSITVFQLDDDEVEFRPDERTKRVQVPYEYSANGFRGELATTGSLTLTVVRTYPNRALTLTDKAGAPIETRLHEVIALLPTLRKELHEARLDRDRRLREAEESELRRREQARMEQVARSERIRLINDLLAWERAERLRAFVARVERAGDTVGESAVVSDWAHWARELADQLDPLLDHPKEITTSLEASGKHYSVDTTNDWWR